MKESFKLWQNYQLFLEQPDFDPQSANFVDYANQNRDFILEKNQPSGTTAVVIPAFNEQRRIARTLAGVNQALQHFDQPIQLIVVDNASSDQTAEISQYFGATVVKEQKKGVGAARQTGLYSLDHNTQSVLTTDSDTVVAPFWITNHSQAL